MKFPEREQPAERSMQDEYCRTSAMAANEDVFGFVDAGREIRRPPLVGMQFLDQGAVSASDFLRGHSG